MPIRTRAPRLRLHALAITLLALEAAPAAAAPPANADADTYLHAARPGDTLIGIAKRLLAHPGDWRAIARINRMSDPDVLPTGGQLRIPLDLLASNATPVDVVETVGDARLRRVNGADQPLARDAILGEGDRIDTGADGYVTLRLADGSLLRLQAESSAEIARARSYTATDTVAASLRLLRGRVEAVVTRLRGGQPHFDVRTPQATLAVRGTEFRVSTGAETHGEVVHGVVGVGAQGGTAAATNLNAGFGTVVDASRHVAAPIALLPAPDASALPALFERKLLRISVPPLAGATGWRMQIASDAAFGNVAREAIAAAPDFRIVDLPDGDWHLRVRAIGERGLEGLDAVHAFRVHAEPEPPLTIAPAPDAKLRAHGIDFRWTANPAAVAGYRFQLAAADNANFSAAIDDRRLTDTALTLPELPAGRYRWRVASLRAPDDAGPWGDAIGVSLLPPPATATPEVGDDSVRFAWTGEPGQHYDFQLGRDATFAAPEVVAQLDLPRLELPRPRPAGRLFMRYRAIDPDGFIGPWTAPQTLDVPVCLESAAGACWRSGAGGVLLTS